MKRGFTEDVLYVLIVGQDLGSLWENRISISVNNKD